MSSSLEPNTYIILLCFVIDSKIKKKYGLEDVEAALAESIEEWEDAVGEQDFLLGATPSLADLSVYGVTSMLFLSSYYNIDILSTVDAFDETKPFIGID